MPTFLEADLLAPVRSTLQRRGYRRQSAEVQFFDYRMDLYGYAAKRDATIAVELKLRRWQRAFEQALIYQLCADFVYLALPSPIASRVDAALLRQHGLGLIAVHRAQRCVLLVEPQQSEVIVSNYRRFYVDLMLEGTS